MACPIRGLVYERVDLVAAGLVRLAENDDGSEVAIAQDLADREYAACEGSGCARPDCAKNKLRVAEVVLLLAAINEGLNEPQARIN